MFQTYQSSYEEEGEMNNFQAFMSGFFFFPAPPTMNFT